MKLNLKFIFELFFLTSIYFLPLTCNADENNVDNKHIPDVEDYQYNHYAILSRGESEIFNKLTPEECKDRLSEMFDKMDLDLDGKINVYELRTWIKNAYQTILDEDLEIQWKLIANEDTDKVDFQSFLNNAFKSELDDKKEQLIIMEQRRWTAADLDNDNLLNKTELLRFLHPEEFPDMKPILAQESLDELDKNKDGFVDIDEYMKDIFPEGQQIKDEWIRHERQNFGIDRDMNKDGYLDLEEIQSWLLPDSYDRMAAEAEHLMDRAGAVNDRVLTKSQMLDKYYIFVGSRNKSPNKDIVGREDL